MGRDNGLWRHALLLLFGGPALGSQKRWGLFTGDFFVLLDGLEFPLFPDGYGTTTGVVAFLRA